MSDIQKARDVLMKWREDATPGPWTKRGIGYVFSNYESPRTKENGYTGTPIADTFMWPEGGESNLALIVGTAGNPELLDAIDGFLADELVDSGVCHCGTYLEDHHLKEHGFVDMCIQPNPLADAIAAAILAADERMSA